jgi:hypothetical protein
MTTQAKHSPSDTELLDTSRLSLSTRFGAFMTYLAAWIETCAAYYKAAALYDQVSGLSDAELHRRGLSRLGKTRKLFRSEQRCSGKQETPAFVAQRRRRLPSSRVWRTPL